MLFKSLKNIKNTLEGSNQPGNLAGFLRPIDTDRLAKNLNIDEVAATEGQKEHPLSDATSPDWMEQKIISSIQEEWTWQAGELINNLRAYKQRLIGFSIAAEHARLKTEAEDALAKLRGASSRSIADLGPLQDAHFEAKQELLAFKRRHRLNRPPRINSKRWTTFGLLTILVGFESVLNGFFFAKGSDLGLLGGIGTAIGISLVNIIFAFMLGLFPARWVNHRNIFVKAIGAILSISGGAAIICVHAFAAHLREASARVGEELAFKEALHFLFADPLNISDLNSFYLFALGVVFALSAFYKGYTFDDPYPGYGAVSRRAHHARERYSDEHSLLFDDLDDIKDATMQSLQAGIARIPLFPQSAAAIRAERSAIVQTFRSYESQIETAANELLTRYRSKNQQSRKSHSPAHFSERWVLPQSVLASAEIKVLTTDADLPSEKNENEALTELTLLASAVLNEHRILHERFPHPTEVKGVPNE